MAESAFVGTRLYLLDDSSCPILLTERHSRSILGNGFGNRVPAIPIHPCLLDTREAVTPTPKFKVRYSAPVSMLSDSRIVSA